MDNNEFLFRTTNTLVIARKSKIFVAIQKIRVWLWITSSLPFLVMTVNFYTLPYSSPLNGFHYCP